MSLASPSRRRVGYERWRLVLDVRKAGFMANLGVGFVDDLGVAFVDD